MIPIQIIAALIVLALLFSIGQLFNLWMQAFARGARISFIDLIRMRFNRIDPIEIVGARIQALSAGLTIDTDQLVLHYVTVGRRRGRVMNVVNALITASRNKIELPWDIACAIDIDLEDGQDIYDAFLASLNPQQENASGEGPGLSEGNGPSKDHATRA